MLVIVNEVIPLPQVVVSVHEALVVNPELEFFSVLREIETMWPYLYIVIHQIPQGLLFVYDGAVSQ